MMAGAVLAGTNALAATQQEEGPGPLPWRVHGRLGFTVDAAAFPDSSGHQLEIYVRIPPTTVAALVRDEKGAARTRLSVRLKNRFGAKQHEASEEFAVAPGDTSLGFGKVIVLPFPVKPGGYRMTVRLEDPLSRKRGITYVGRKVAESTEVEGDVVVNEPRAGHELSDPEFIWAEADSVNAGAFRRGQHALLPNPERLYGLFANDLVAGFVARTGNTDPRAWHWRARVYDAKTKMVAERESSATASRELFATVVLDLAKEPSGGYDLDLKVWQEGDSLAMTRRAHFSIAWEPGSWERNPTEREDIVHFLLHPDVEERFARMHPGEQERFLVDFWKERDPTPETAQNEVRDAFFARVDRANKNFGRFGLAKGMFSDMGRTFIRYGEPDEILRQVIPSGDQSLTQAIELLELTEDRPTGDVHQKGLGADTRAFEVWIYEGSQPDPNDVNDAALESALLPRPHRRTVFLFVDEQGYGDYTLRYTTE
jgi:GWxTD domain-containing protein